MPTRIKAKWPVNAGVDLGLWVDLVESDPAKRQTAPTRAEPSSLRGSLYAMFQLPGLQPRADSAPSVDRAKEGTIANISEGPPVRDRGQGLR